MPRAAEVETPCEATPEWKCDAPAVVAGSAVLTVSLAALTYAPLTGLPNVFGPAAAAIARDGCDALGVALVPTLAGAGLFVASYAACETWPKLLVRATGWGVVGGALAGLADLTWGNSSAVSVYGDGGAIGAALAFTLRDHAAAPGPALILIGIGTIGLTFAAGRTVQFVLRQLSHFTAWIGHGVAQFLGDVRRRIGIAVRDWREQRRLRQATPPVVTLTPVADVTRLPKPLPPAETPTFGLAQTPPPGQSLPRPTLPTGPVPITRPVTPMPPARPLMTNPDGYELPSLDILTDAEAHPETDREQRLRERAMLLEKTFADFGLTVKVVGIHTGPVITQYEVALDTGLRLSKVMTLADDLALCLGVMSVRVVAVPGRNTVGVEIPNDHRQVVRLKELILATQQRAATFKLPVFVGKDVEGRPLVYDMAAMPHLLIAGRTGTGKSVCLNAVILSFLYTRSPEDCRLILIDPKKVELSEYGRVPHLMHPVVTDDKKSEAILAWAVDKMEERYELLRKARVRNVHSYNELGREELLRRIDPQTQEERESISSRLPYIVIVVDEVGDLLMSMKKEVEGHIIRLAQKSRAAGIHLILATQKPTVDVITGLIKSNLPARICFQVASRADSAVVLDEKGADKLLGMGDMLFLQPGTSTILRAQGAYVDDREIERTVEALSVYEPNFEAELLNLKTRDQVEAGGLGGDKLRERDPIYEQAVEVVIREQRGSTSLLQRALGIGYGKASRLIDFMYEDGIVGAYNGSNARDVLVSGEEWALRRGE